MILGTLFFSLVQWWLVTLKLVFIQPWFIMKVAFLWFCMTFAITYLFFLIVHKTDVIYVRKVFAIELARSCGIGFAVASLLIALYEFILHNVLQSKFFYPQQLMLKDLTLLHHEPEALYQRLCFLMIFISGLCATHYVGQVLSQWYQEYIINRYGWCVIITTLICWGFLWSVRYVI